MPKIVKEMSSQEINDTLVTNYKIVSELINNAVKKAFASEKNKVFIDKIIAAKTIYVVGDGRSGLAMDAFGLRLHHLGFNCYIIGSLILPAIDSESCIIGGSGSGESNIMINTFSTAKIKGAERVLITSNIDSTAAKLANLILEIEGRVCVDEADDFLVRQLTGENTEDRLPLGTLFERVLGAYLDEIIHVIMKKTGQTSKDLGSRHENVYKRQNGDN